MPHRASHPRPWPVAAAIDPAISSTSLRRTASAKLARLSAVTTKAPGPATTRSANSTSRLPAPCRPEQGASQSTASALMTMPASSAATRASISVGARGFQALSPERSITLRKPSKRLPSISSTPFSSAAPMALTPCTRRGAATIRSAKAVAEPASAITAQSTTTSCRRRPAHST